MASGLLPLAMRMNLDPAVRVALVLLCDVADRFGEQFIATLSDKQLAAMLGGTVSAARKVRMRLVAAGLIQRGQRQSQWVITIPGKDAINDVVRCNYLALGGLPDDAPVIGKKWRTQRAEDDGHPVDNSKKKAHTGAVSPEEKSPCRTREKPIQGRFQKPSNKGLHRTGENSGAGPHSAPEDFEQLGSGDAAEGWLAGKGLRDAAQREPAPNDETGAAPPAGDLSGMIG
ncbi:helix-turn-helix domain-containing protein [Cupriavidus sp. DL-D2]|uniref:helix-turn-helix domain-containing protein n=1 Tax=Cupriavidus sp. DL-D2 TaxID=3144974 RepID=UPI0032143462